MTMKADEFLEAVAERLQRTFPAPENPPQWIAAVVWANNDMGLIVVDPYLTLRLSSEIHEPDVRRQARLELPR